MKPLPRVSYCMTCKNRAHHVRETLPPTLDAILPGDEVVLLDFDSDDELADWVKKSLQIEIRHQRVRFVQLLESPVPWHPTRAKNIAHKAAKREAVCNLDADNQVVPGFSQWLRESLGSVSQGITHMSNRSLGGGFGRIGMLLKDFVALGGYDERLKSWGWDDNDLILRAKAAGYRLILTPDEFISFHSHPDHTRFFCDGSTNKRESLALNRQFTNDSLRTRRFKANEGQEWGAGNVLINFKS